MINYSDAVIRIIASFSLGSEKIMMKMNILHVHVDLSTRFLRFHNQTKQTNKLITDLLPHQSISIKFTPTYSIYLSSGLHLDSSAWDQLDMDAIGCSQRDSR
jgi:hypothetical protein